MMKRQLVIGFITSLLVSPLFSSHVTAEDIFFPQQQTAQQLLVQCASSLLTPTGRERRRYCHGFVSGVEEAVRFSRPGESVKTLCVPQQTRASELAKSYIRYANSHEADLVKPAVGVVIDALISAYACPAE